MISVRSDETLDDGQDGMQAATAMSVTKAGDDATLSYTLEAWTRDASPRCVLHKTVQGTFSGAEFDIALVPGEYDLLFWADHGTGHYTTSNLRQVSIAELPYVPGDDRDAFACARQSVKWDGGTLGSITLTRPLAKLDMRNNEGFNTAKQVSVTYGGLLTRYDVLTGKASFPRESVTVAFPETTAGSDAIGEDFLFVPSEGHNISLSMTVGVETKTLDILPLEPNHKTNVTATFGNSLTTYQ